MYYLCNTSFVGGSRAGPCMPGTMYPSPQPLPHVWDQERCYSRRCSKRGGTLRVINLKGTKPARTHWPRGRTGHEDALAMRGQGRTGHARTRTYWPCVDEDGSDRAWTRTAVTVRGRQ